MIARTSKLTASPERSRATLLAANYLELWPVSLEYATGTSTSDSGDEIADTIVRTIFGTVSASEITSELGTPTCSKSIRATLLLLRLLLLDEIIK